MGAFSKYIYIYILRKLWNADRENLKLKIWRNVVDSNLLLKMIILKLHENF